MDVLPFPPCCIGCPPISYGIGCPPISYGGTINKLIEKLAGMHDKVSVVFVTSESITAKAQCIIKEIIAGLTPDEKAAYAKKLDSQAESLPEGVLNEMKKTLGERLDQEFASYRDTIQNYQALISGIVENIRYAEPAAELLEELKSLSEKMQLATTPSSSFLPQFSSSANPNQGNAEEEKEVTSLLGEGQKTTVVSQTGRRASW